jgi:osmotically inducible protein OsmC
MVEQAAWSRLIASSYCRSTFEVLVFTPSSVDLMDRMKPFSRQASVSWQGTHARGKGDMTTTSATLHKTPYGHGQRLDGKGTNPPELIAAAHAGSFSIALAHELGDAGYNSDQIDTIATVTMEKNSPGWSVTQIHLDVTAVVPRAKQCDFIDATMRAKASCPISRVLNANISMRAKLKRLQQKEQKP